MAMTPGEGQALAPKVSTSSIDTFFSRHSGGGSGYDNVGNTGGQQPEDATIVGQTTTSHDSTITDQPAQHMDDSDNIGTELSGYATIKGHNTTSYYTNTTGVMPQQMDAHSKDENSESAIRPRNQDHVSPYNSVILPTSVPCTSTVPEFLYQLTKMLTDNNRDIIEWSNGKIEVHNPHKLQTHVLNRYFRHSKFASFQRQLNYFGFRKLAGKGKMAPCSYVNDATTIELGSLLTIKRKIGIEPTKAKVSTKKRDREEVPLAGEAVSVAKGSSVNPVLANILFRSAGNETSNPPSSTAPENGIFPSNPSQQEIARKAVGRGIRHSFSHPSSIKPAPLPPRQALSAQAEPNGLTPSQSSGSVAPVVQASLSALKSNFQNSLDAVKEQIARSTEQSNDTSSQIMYVPGSLRRDDSLVDLAMIPLVDGENETDLFSSTGGLSFIDFPWQDPSMSSGG